MSITIRHVSEDDIKALLPIFLDMECHYDGDHAVDQATARTRLADALRGHHGVMLAASGDGGPLGFLSMFEMFPGQHLRPVWFMKELYVHDSARGRGVGKALIRHAAGIVLERGGSRLDFATGRDNLGARRFYARMGAGEVPALFLRFDEATLLGITKDQGNDLPA